MHPERTHAAAMTLVAEVRQRLHSNDPAAYVIGEMCDAFTSQYIDLWMSWYPRIDIALRSVYSLPRTLQSWVVDNDASQASHAFALGMQLCLCTRGNEGTLADVPAFRRTRGETGALATSPRAMAGDCSVPRSRGRTALGLGRGGGLQFPYLPGTRGDRRRTRRGRHAACQP